MWAQIANSGAIPVGANRVVKRRGALGWRGELGCGRRGRGNTVVHPCEFERRVGRKYGYLPDRQVKATQTVLEQVEVLSERWALVA